MMVLAMTGLAVVQVQLLRNAWQLKEQAFDRNATAALSLTIRQLESGDFHKEAGIILKQGAFPDRLVFNELRRDTTLIMDRTLSVFISGGRQETIQRVVADLMILTPRSFAERTSEAGIDSLLVKNLKTVGIGTRPRFAVYAGDEDSLVISNAVLFDSSAINSSYRAQLFPLDYLPPSYDLVLWFPGRTTFLINQTWPLALASVIFMIVVMISFWLNLRVITEQRRTSGTMIDFINNMTHQFKTPISTVNLASEAIAGLEFQDCPESLQHYNRMIHQESRRMSRHAERILQFAYLEDGDFDLNETTVAMHDVIRDSCAAFQLATENRQGRLEFDLAAEQDLVPGDVSHLANVVSNLVDNALKYSPGMPEVKVSTSNSAGCFVMQVMDRGLGMSKADQRRVFERYFRCSTGNRHDVKGFGLGLSYVKLLVDAHQGRIQLDSRLGQGTTIRIFLPLQTAGQCRG